MSTVRLQIVKAVATALGTATGLPVFRNLDFAIEEEKLPALVVISGPDRPDEEATQTHVLDQSTLLEVTVLVAHSADPESEADPHEAAIHAALMVATAFGGHSVKVDRVSGDWSFDLGDCAARHLSYRISYRTAFANLEA